MNSTATPEATAHAAERAGLRKDGLVLTSVDFEQLRREICASGPASRYGDLEGMHLDFAWHLGDHMYADCEDPGLWQDMDVQRHPGARWLITGRAEGRREDADAIGALLARIWEEYLRYRHRAGHTIETTPDHVTFRAVTQMRAARAMGNRDRSGGSGLTPRICRISRATSGRMCPSRCRVLPPARTLDQLLANVCGRPVTADRTEGRRRGKGRALQRQGDIAMMAWAAR